MLVRTPPTLNLFSESNFTSHFTVSLKTIHLLVSLVKQFRFVLVVGTVHSYSCDVCLATVRKMKRALKQQGIKMSWWDQDDQKEARKFLKDLSGDKRPICWDAHQVYIYMFCGVVCYDAMRCDVM